MSTLRVGTFNLLYANGETGTGAWSERRDLVARAITHARPDALAMQEVFPEGLEDVTRVVGDLTVVPGPLAGPPHPLDFSLQGELILRALRTGRPPDRSATAGLGSTRRRLGEHQPIAYRRDRLDPVEAGAFWISATPDRPGSMLPFAMKPYFVHWIRFARRDSARALFVLNGHFGHAPWNYLHTARTIATHVAAMEARRVAAGEGRPDVVLLGDFNAPPWSALVRRLTDSGPAGFVNAGRTAAERSGPSHTFHWGTATTSFGITLDHVLVRGALRPRRAEVVDVHEGRLYPSDHYPLMVEFEDVE